MSDGIKVVPPPRIPLRQLNHLLNWSVLVRAKQYQIIRHGRISSDYSSGPHQARMGAYRTSTACRKELG